MQLLGVRRSREIPPVAIMYRSAVLLGISPEAGEPLRRDELKSIEEFDGSIDDGRSGQSNATIYFGPQCKDGLGPLGFAIFEIMDLVDHHRFGHSV